MASFTPFSRRTLLGSGAAALAFTPTIVRAATPPPTGSRVPDTTLPPLPPETEQIEGRSDIAKRLTVQGTINGKGPYSFVVDTGADRTVIAYELAQELGLLKGVDVIVQGISRALPAPTVNLDTVQVGSIQLSNVNAPVLPRNWLGADGYLGLDVIDGRRVIFDFMHHNMTIAPPGSALSSWANHNEAIIHARGDNGRLIAVNCTVDRVSTHAFVDSGAEISIGNTHLMDRLKERGATYMTDLTIPLIGVTGGMVPGRIVAINAVSLGDMNFNNTILVIA
ncbi:MAG: aspartyl protease family protein, partial [Alphaproteobacteria bacterium]|nr:aspartyl protease family protein [Alphaproteobacteria bacterium]